jgi:putative ABC transport system permease protein
VRREDAAHALVVRGSSLSMRARKAASGLVVAEVALAVVLLVGAGLILRTFAHLLRVHPGFNADQVLTLDIAIPPDRYKDAAARRAFFDRAFAEITAAAQVTDAGAAVVTPLTGNNWTIGFDRIDRPAPPGRRPPDVGWQAASGGYFRVLQIPLVSGRLFDARDRPGAAPVVIVSEAIAKTYFPGEDAVGKEIHLDGKIAQIVGVVGNVRRAALTDEPRADMYLPFEQNPINAITLFIRTEQEPTAVIPAIQTLLRSIEPNIVLLEADTLAAVTRRSLQVTQFALFLLAAFASIALALAAVGIYGVMSYVVRQRTREIGTRVALGATHRNIVWLVMREGTAMWAIGTLIGAAAGVVLARTLVAFLYNVAPWDPLTITGAVLVLGCSTLAACYIPAKRAASVDPARTLAES